MTDSKMSMAFFRRQTILASALMSSHLHFGDSAIDATAGTGSDTLMLAKAVGNNGKVYAFDIQEKAAVMTRNQIEEAGLSDRLRFYLRSHDELCQISEITQDLNIRGVMFNLGYLPGGNHQIVTKTETTLSALQQGLTLMAEDGLMTICAYRHLEGEAEWLAVDKFCAGLGSGIDVHKIEALNHQKSPVLYLVHKRGKTIETPFESGRLY